MTTLKQKLAEDRIKHWKAGDTLQKDVLALVLGGIQTAEKAGKNAVEFTDEQVLAFLATEVKKRRDTADTYRTAGVTDRAERETAEADFLATYLPAQLTTEQITVIVDEVLAGFETIGNIGQVIGAVMKRVKGKADGNVVRGIVEARILQR